MAVPCTEGLAASGPLHIGMVIYDLVDGEEADSSSLICCQIIPCTKVIEDASVLYKGTAVVALDIRGAGTELAEEVQLFTYEVYTAHFSKTDKEEPVARAMEFKTVFHRLQAQFSFEDR